MMQVVGNMAKGRISKRRKQEYKARQIFGKTNMFYPLIRTRACAYQGVKSVRFSYQGVTNVRFSENVESFVFLLPPF